MPTGKQAFWSALLHKPDAPWAVLSSNRAAGLYIKLSLSLRSEIYEEMPAMILTRALPALFLCIA